MLATQTIDVIKSTVPLLEEHGRTITDVFYDNLFNSHPSLKNIFNMANQGKGEQSRALSDAVIAYAKNIENIEVLIPTVQRIANKHVSLGVQKDHYAVVGETLLGAIQEVLSIDQDHPAIDAWGKAYGVLADVFIDTEESIYTENKVQKGGWEGFKDFHINKIETETPDVKSFYLTPVDQNELPTFKGGQYLGVRVKPNDSEHFQIRQYSLSSIDEFRITVKAETDGVVSNYLHSLNEKDIIEIQAPTGVFTLGDKEKKNIFLAGGVGITPMMSMLKESLNSEATSEHNLFIQCSNDEEHQIYKHYLNDASQNNKMLFKRCFEESQQGDHQGFLTLDVLKSWLEENDFDSKNSQAYFCGPMPFMSLLNQFFIALGYNTSDIHYEVFGPTAEL